MAENSDISARSAGSHARIKIKRAFSLNSNYGKKDDKFNKSGLKIHKRSTSNTSQLSQQSLKKIHTFALKKDQKKFCITQKNQPQDERKAKVYYVEEHVKIIQEIISQADPILGELSSKIYQF